MSFATSKKCFETIVQCENCYATVVPDKFTIRDRKVDAIQESHVSAVSEETAVELELAAFVKAITAGSSVDAGLSPKEALQDVKIVR